VRSEDRTRDHGAGVGCDTARYLLGIEAIARRVNVCEHRDGAHHEHGGGRGDERVRRDNHLVARLDPERLEPDLYSHAPVGDREGECGAVEVSELVPEKSPHGLRVVALKPGKPARAGEHFFDPLPFLFPSLRPGGKRLCPDRDSAFQSEFRHTSGLTPPLPKGLS